MPEFQALPPQLQVGDGCIAATGVTAGAGWAAGGTAAGATEGAAWLEDWVEGVTDLRAFPTFMENTPSFYTACCRFDD